MNLLVAVLLLFLAGCAGKVPTVQEFLPLPEDAACRVTFLPLVDKGSYPMGAAIFYEIFLAELVATGHFQMAGEGDVLELYRQFRIYPNRQPTGEQLRMIGGRLGTNLFIGGDILKMEEHGSGEFPDTELTVVLRFYDGPTGREIWTTYHHRRGRDYQQVLHFGRINTLASLAKRMAREIINLWLAKGMKPCPG